MIIDTDTPAGSSPGTKAPVREVSAGLSKAPMPLLRRDGHRWGISVAAGLPALLVALAVPLLVNGAPAGFIVTPVVIAVIVIAGIAGALAGLGVIVVGVGAAIWVASATGFPAIALAAVTCGLAGAAWLAWMLSRGRWPAAAALPGVTITIFALLLGLSGTLEGRLIASLAAISIALLAFLTGTWAVTDGVRTTRVGEVTAVLMLVVAGISTFITSAALTDRLGAPARLSWLGISDPIDSPSGTPPDPFFIAARWQLDPAESQRELFTVVVSEQTPLNRPIWASFTRYNGLGWLDVPTFTRSGDALSPPITDGWVGARTRIDIGLALPGQWVPAPQQVTQVLGATATRVDEESQVVTALSSPVDQVFDISYATPTATDAQLQDASADVLDDIDAAVLLPGPLPPRLQRIADRVAERAGPNTWDRLLELSQFLREGRFAPAPPTALATGAPDRTYEGLADMLEAGVGVQEQYAAVWALIARSWGVPTRLVIGWLPPQPGTGSPATVAVFGADTSVWAQARLTDLGWVSYQPSPQDRLAGRPAVVRPLQPSEAPDPAPDPDVTPVPSPDGGGGGDDTSGTGDRQSSGPPAWVFVVALVLVLVGSGLAWSWFVTRSRPRLRRQLADQEPELSAESAVAWVRALLAEAHLALPRAWSPAQVPMELPDHPRDIAQAVTDFAILAAPIRFSGGVVSAEQAQAVWQEADRIDAILLTHAGRPLRWRRRWQRLVVPRQR